MQEQIIVAETPKEIRYLARMALNGLWWKAFLGVVIYQLLVVAVPTVIDLIFPGTRIEYTYPLSEYGLDYPELGMLEDYKVSFSTVSYVYRLLLAGPFVIGFSRFIFLIVRRGEIAYGTLLDGFQIFIKAFLVQIMVALITAAWTLPAIIVGSFLIIISPLMSIVAMIGTFAVGVWAYLRYAMATYYLADNSNLGVMECIRLSKTSMQGNKGNLFGLIISFIGWAIVASLLQGVIAMLIPASGEVLGAIVGFISSAPNFLLLLYLTTSEVFFYELLTGHLKRN